LNEKRSKLFIVYELVVVLRNYFEKEDEGFELHATLRIFLKKFVLVVNLFRYVFSARKYAK